MGLSGQKRFQDWRDDAKSTLQKEGIEPSEVEVELNAMAQFVLGLTRSQLITRRDALLTNEQLSVLAQMIKRRSQREPLSHILGEWEFWSLPFKVTSDTLTPRADTEVLIEEALKWLSHTPLNKLGGTVIDVGTGTGCIGLSIASERPDLSYDLIDLCPQALQVAQENANALRAAGMIKSSTHLTFTLSDLLTSSVLHRDLIMIVSNPPYIRRDVQSTLMPEVKHYEPDLSLFGEDLDGLGTVRRLISQASTLLPKHGALFLEVGFDQTEATADFFRQSNFEYVQMRRDYGGNPRVVWGIKALD